MEESIFSNSASRTAEESAAHTFPTYDFEEWKAKNQQQPFEHLGDLREQRVRCPHCGQYLTFNAYTFAQACHSCGRAVRLSEEQARRYWPVQAMLPFAVTQAMAQQRFGDWMRRQWKAPEWLRKDGASAVEFKGYYLPFWSFEVDTDTTYRVFFQDGRFFIKNGKHWSFNWRNRTWKSGRLERHFDNVLVPAGNFFDSPEILEGCAYWDFGNLVPFDPKRVEGYTTELYTLTFAEDEERIRQYITDSVQRIILPEEAMRVSFGQFEMKTANVRFKLVLLPLWMATLEYGEESYQFVVSGRTGRPCGRVPESEQKLGLLMGGVVAVVLLFIYWKDIIAFLFG